MSKVAVEGDEGFVLHGYPYMETSLIVEAFTRRHGRVACVAKGARRPKSNLRGTLQAFQPLALAWFGKSELKTLKTAEPSRIGPQLTGQALLSGFYVNELLLKLSHRDDAHESLYEAYEEAIHKLQTLSLPGAMSGDAGTPLSPARLIAPVLRQFERRLLAELGYGLMLEEDSRHQAIVPGQRYAYVLEHGPMPVAATRAGQGAALELQGKSLLDIARDDYRDPVSAAEAKQLMRHVLNHHLNGAELHTRQLIRELQQT
ncbi:MAG: DNA repair protein RecO [Burkholderiales bacterium]|nr:DNA repair protein RecO [Burkholderiales bacterium]